LINYERLANRAHIGLFVSRITDGVWLYANDHLAEIFGYTIAELLEMNALHIWQHPVDRRHAMTLLEKQGYFTDYKMAIRQQDGEIRQCLSSARIYSSEGVIEGSVVDVTNADQEREELVILQELFMQNVAHEQRTPLTLAMGYVKLLLKESFGALTDGQRDALNVVDRRLEDLALLVGNLLTALELQIHGLYQRDMVSINVAAIVGWLVRDIQPLFDEEAKTLVYNAPDQPVMVLGVPSMIQQALANLIANALKFTHTGGVVNIVVTQADDDAVIQVIDSGIGIDPSEHERVFERFYQIDGTETRRYGGVGLGLAVVRDIATAHGGTVEVESELGAGSTFVMRIPLDGATD
jgi:PAS domain S-box-containing protein